MARRLSRRTMLQLLAVAPTFASRRLSAAAIPGVDVIDAQAPARLQVGLFSRHLQWTNVERAIDVTRQIGFDAIEWAVRPGGHISPERVETDLPKVVESSRKAGLAVTMIATAILDARSPYAEAILRTAQGLGIRYYRGGMFRYDYHGDLEQQLDALKPRVATLVELNQKYGMTIAYHTHSGPGNIGGNVWDLWTVIKQFDPEIIAFFLEHRLRRGARLQNGKACGSIFFRTDLVERRIDGHVGRGPDIKLDLMRLPIVRPHFGRDIGYRPGQKIQVIQQ